MVVVVLAALGAFGHFVVVDEVDFAADEGFDVVGFGGFVEVDGAEEVAVVGEGKGWHAELVGPVAEGVEAAAAIEEAVVGVDVEVDEWVGFAHGSWVVGCSSPRCFWGMR